MHSLILSPIFPWGEPGLDFSQGDALYTQLLANLSSNVLSIFTRAAVRGFFVVTIVSLQALNAYCLYKGRLCPLCAHSG